MPNEDLELDETEIICPDCDGEKKIDLVFKIEDPCRTCSGTGKIRDPESTLEEPMDDILSWKVVKSAELYYGRFSSFNVERGDIVYINRNDGTIEHVRVNGTHFKRRVDEELVEGLIESMGDADEMKRRRLN